MDGAGFITQIQPPRFDQHLPASLLGTLSCHPSLYTAIRQNIKKDWQVKWIKLIILLQWDVLWGKNRWCWHSHGSRLICTAFSKHCWRPSRPTHSNGTPTYWPLRQDLTPHYSGMVWGSWQTAPTWPPDSPWSQLDPQESWGSHAKAMLPDPTGHPWGPVSDLSRLRHRTAGGAPWCQAIATPWADVRRCSVACTDFLKGRDLFVSQEGTLARVFAPRRAVYHVLTSQGGRLVCFTKQEGTLARFFGSKEGTLAHVLAPKRAF